MFYKCIKILRHKSYIVNKSFENVRSTSADYGFQTYVFTSKCRIWPEICNNIYKLISKLSHGET